jgi:hypothetical protein
MTPEKIASLKSQYTSEARWRREMEIDYGALGGQLVFPDFDESMHVVTSNLPLDHFGVTTWLGADPHPRTPHAFLWLAVNKEGELAVVWSWWPDEQTETRLTIPFYASRLRKMDRALINPYRRVMDVAGKSFNADEKRDYFQAYREAKDDEGNSIGISFQPAKKNIGYQGYEKISQALKPRKVKIDGVEVVRPLLTIWRGCGDNHKLIHRLRTLRYREWKNNVTDKNAPEEPEDKERHLVDCLSYIMLDRPRFVEQRGPEEDDDEDDPNIVIAGGDSGN